MNTYDLYCPECGYTEHDVITDYSVSFHCPLCDSRLIKNIKENAANLQRHELLCSKLRVKPEV